LDLAGAAGQDPLASLPLAWLILLAALRGDQDRFTQYLTELEQPIRARDAGRTSVVSRDVILWAKGIAVADPPTALHHLEQITHPMLRNMSALDRVEAAARAGRQQQLANWADELACTADQTEMPWAAAAAAHAQALLADGTEAASLFERALEAHKNSPRRPDRARTQLAFGEYLRRSRRRTNAREHMNDYP
jgi:hypothetical protein